VRGFDRWHPYHAWDFYTADLDGTNDRQLTHESFYQASARSSSPEQLPPSTHMDSLRLSGDVAVVRQRSAGR
jgi:hypothetical protein